MLILMSSPISQHHQQFMMNNTSSDYTDTKPLSQSSSSAESTSDKLITQPSQPSLHQTLYHQYNYNSNAATVNGNEMNPATTTTANTNVGMLHSCLSQDFISDLLLLHQDTTTQGDNNSMPNRGDPYHHHITHHF